MNPKNYPRQTRLVLKCFTRNELKSEQQFETIGTNGGQSDGNWASKEDKSRFVA